MNRKSYVVPYSYSDETPLCSQEYVLPKVLDLMPAPSGGTRVLDVGCGNGAITAELANRGYSVVGIDLSEEGIEIARQRCPGARFEIMDADVELLDALAEEPFDAVVAIEIVEHLYKPVSCLRGWCEALAPGGTLVASTPYHGYLKNIAIAASGKFDSHVHPLEEGGHIKFFSRRNLTAALERAGFTDVKIVGSGRLPFLWKSMICRASRPQ
jgi:2-polyprenyl-3-methyl-5-hydroxy-6-metoxy-1,4-benzoquinol methylase